MMVSSLTDKSEFVRPYVEQLQSISETDENRVVRIHCLGAIKAAELGLDTCWCNYFANSKLKEAFNLPANEKPVLIMPIGYAEENAKPALGHEKRSCSPKR